MGTSPGSASVNAGDFGGNGSDKTDKSCNAECPIHSHVSHGEMLFSVWRAENCVWERNGKMGFGVWVECELRGKGKSGSIYWGVAMAGLVIKCSVLLI